ncbi:MAG: tributyrin esterase [Thermoplasmata archaeon]|nr:MAG: tributyrin esterase [Thermoplasmata archaeon]
MVEIDAGGKELRKVNAEIRKILLKGEPVVVKNAGECYGLASGLRKGVVKIVGDANDYVGTVNSGAEIIVEGTAGNFLGDNMVSGKIVVAGDAGYGTGMYCYGGKMLITGNAGDFTGTMNKGATIVIGGNVGHDVATYMANGEIIILGDAGMKLGNYIIRGAIYLAGKTKSLGNNMKEVALTAEDITRLEKLLKKDGVDVNLKELKKYVPKTDKPFYKDKSGDLWEGCECR